MDDGGKVGLQSAWPGFCNFRERVSISGRWPFPVEVHFRWNLKNKNFKFFSFLVCNGLRVLLSERCEV